MRDFIFFPLAALLACGMVFVAIMPAFGAKPSGPVTGDGVNYDRIEVSGDLLYKLIAGGDIKTEMKEAPDGEKRLLIEVEAGALADGVEYGPHFRLAADIETQFAGRRVRVTISAEPAEIKGAEQLLVNYSAGRAGESGWEVFDLGQQKRDVSFEYKVPNAQGDQASDYLGIRPVVPDGYRGVLISKIVLQRLPD